MHVYMRKLNLDRGSDRVSVHIHTHLPTRTRTHAHTWLGEVTAAAVKKIREKFMPATLSASVFVLFVTGKQVN